eukprot:1161504-Pelagomonas_calceolata.AAC.5
MLARTGASWYLVSGRDADIRGVLGLVRAPERAAATACALDLLRLALRPEVSEEGGVAPVGTLVGGAPTPGAAGAASAASAGIRERAAGTVAAAKNIAGLEAGALLRVPRKQLVLQVYSADGECVRGCVGVGVWVYMSLVPQVLCKQLVAAIAQHGGKVFAEPEVGGMGKW